MEQNGGQNQFQSQDVPLTNSISSGSEPQAESAPLLQWQASEFIDHQKSIAWFLPLGVGAVVIAGAVYFLTHDILSTLVILLAALAFGLYAAQKPRTLTYVLLPTSLKVGLRSYSYDDFRTFSIVQDGALFSILLEPMKRFIPPLTIYFAPEDGEQIFDILTKHIPHQERKPDSIERLMRKIRF